MEGPPSNLTSGALGGGRERQQDAQCDEEQACVSHERASLCESVDGSQAAHKPVRDVRGSRRSFFIMIGQSDESGSPMKGGELMAKGTGMRKEKKKPKKKK